MYNIALKTLEIYIRDKRLATHSDMNAEDLAFLSEKKAVFVTISSAGKVVASAGRIQPQKENSLAECIDIALHCLKDPRFSANINNPDSLRDLQIRVDTFANTDRKMLKNISEIEADDGLILLSQRLGTMSVILPKMIANPTPDNFLQIAQKKAGITPGMDSSDMILYSFRTTTFKNY